MPFFKKTQEDVTTKKISFLEKGANSKDALIKNAVLFQVLLEMAQIAFDDYQLNASNTPKDKSGVSSINTELYSLFPLIMAKLKYFCKDEITGQKVPLEDRVQQLIDDAEGSQARKVSKKQRLTDRGEAIKVFHKAFSDFQEIFKLSEADKNVESFANAYRALVLVIDDMPEMKKENYKNIASKGMKLKVENDYKNLRHYFEELNNFEVAAYKKITPFIEKNLGKVFEDMKKEIEPKNKLFLEGVDKALENHETLFSMLPNTAALFFAKEILVSYVTVNNTYPANLKEISDFITLNKNNSKISDKWGAYPDKTIGVMQPLYNFAYIHMKSIVTEAKNNRSKYVTIDKNILKKTLEQAHQARQHTVGVLALQLLEEFRNLPENTSDHSDANTIFYPLNIFTQKLEKFVPDSKGTDILYTSEVVQVAITLYEDAQKILQSASYNNPGNPGMYKNNNNTGGKAEDIVTQEQNISPNPNPGSK